MANKKNSLLWQVSGQDLKEPCYIFGTMHVPDQRAFQNIDAIQDCIASCQAFAAEYDLDQDNALAFQNAILIPEGKTLDQLLTAKHYAKFAKLFKTQTNSELEDYKHLKPIMLVNMLSETLFNDDHSLPLDAFLFQFAKNQGLELLGIESFESQLAVLESMPMESQLKSLKDLASNFKNYRRNTLKTAELYVRGDLQQILRKVKKTSGEMRELLLYNRNRIMANRIEEIGQGVSLFAAIGAGHLAGKKGVLNLLKKKGYTVEPVSYAF